MNERNIEIGKIAHLNQSSISTTDSFNVIQYLDTANITKNAISSLQELHFQKDKIPSRAKRKVRKNTIIYSTVRPNLEHYGFLENPADNLIVSTGFTTIDVHDKDVDSKFLYYLITQKNITDYLHGIGTNSTSSYPSIRPEDLGSLKFKVPPSFNEQKKIASVLSALDDKIELNNKINAELEQMAKTLYDYWFVQFDFPDANGNPYKSSGGAMVWSEELKREIPKNWRTDSLWNIAHYFNGLAMQTYRPVDSTKFLKVIKIKEISDGFSSNTEFARDDINPKAIVENGDILFSWSASLEVTLWAGGRGALNQHIFKVTSQKYPKSFFYFELLQYLQNFKRMADARKTTMGHITQDHLKQSVISIPDETIIKKFDKSVDPILRAIVKHKEENQTLAELRDWLLPMLMNGQVTVK